VLEQGHHRHGPVFRMVLDGVETVVVGTWAGLRELVATERDRLEVLNTALVHELFGRALFNLSGVDHAHARSRLRPALGRRACSEYVPALLEIAAPRVDRWGGRGVEDLHAAVRGLTHAMSARALLGIEPAEPDARVFDEQFARFVHALGGSPGPRRRVEGRYWAGRRARQALHALFARRAAAAEQGSALPGLVAGFVDAPVSVGPLADHLLALLVAAQETTASLITWSLIELAQHPELTQAALAEARHAVTEPEVLARSAALPVLRAVLTETQRRHSPNLLSLRTVVARLELGGHHLPVGTRVAYSPSTGHFDAAVFPQPQQFRPDRFLTQPADAARLVAFGRGVHTCLGRPLAELMVLTAVAAVLARGGPRLPAGPPAGVRYRPTKTPLDPARLVLDGHGTSR
jgi:cytochrome P450